MKPSLYFICATSLFFASCKNINFTDKKNVMHIQAQQQQAIDPTAGEIVTATFFDKNNAAVRMIFDNTKNIATVYLSDDTVELEGQKPASGIWYKNDHYELRGKGADLELTRDGETIFKNEQ